jgi:glyoxylase-like metal-dependent hydrolase (beta-lactamase superfamily II)
VTQLPPSIQFIERDWLSANHIVFFDRETSDQMAVSVVDTGYKKHAALTMRLLQNCLNTQRQIPCRLARIVNTHLHSDHCGGNATLQRAFPSIETWIPQACAAMVREWDVSALTYSATAQECDPFGFTHTYGPGELFQMGGYQWQALAAPGHDNSMLLLYCATLKLLISADALWENGFGVIFPELDNQSGFKEQSETLDLIAGLDIDWVIPGHGPMFNDVSAAISRARSKLAYLQTDPLRHQYMALKVLIKFLLLDKESIPVTQLPSLIRAARLFKQSTQTLGYAVSESDTGKPVQSLLDQVISDLIKSRAATLNNGLLTNH